MGKCDGFVGNCIIFPYISEMVFLVLDGSTSIFQVDNALLKFRMATRTVTMSYIVVNNTG